MVTIIDTKILEELSEIKDNGKHKQERQRAHAILLSNPDLGHKFQRNAYTTEFQFSFRHYIDFIIL